MAFSRHLRELLPQASGEQPQSGAYPGIRYYVPGHRRTRPVAVRPVLVGGVRQHK
jgi:hypothetical protein